MPRTSQHSLNPEELNHLWDMTVDGTPVEGRLAASPEAAVIDWLKTATPAPGGSEINRVRRRLDTAPLPARLVRRGDGPPHARWRSLGGPYERPARGGRFVTGALVAVILVGLLFAGPVRNLWQPNDEQFRGNAPGATIDPWAGPPVRTPDKHSVTVWRGAATVFLADSAATPQVRQVLATGDTFQLDYTESEAAMLEATGPENLPLLTLESAPWSANPTLDQSVDAIAPFWGTWTVPASGEVNLAIRSLTIEPGAKYELSSAAGIFYLVADGDVMTINVGTGATGPLGPGSIVAQLPGDVIHFANQGTDSIRLNQAIVFSGALAEVTAPEPTDGVESELLVEASGSLPAGDASLMLEAHEFSGDGRQGPGASGGESIVLITPSDGVIDVRRDGGDASVVSEPGAEPIEPPLGQNIALEREGYMLVQPNGGWTVSGAPGEPSTGLVLTVSPMVDLTAGATPEVTPKAEPGDTITLRGDPDACDVTPVTGSDIEDLTATPTVNNDPLARSARNRSDGIVDVETASAITDTLQRYVNCESTGEYARMAAYYSDQALRENTTLQDLVARSYDFGASGGMPASVEDIVLFPDGRAGARTVINSEAAYLTFVFEDGLWVIDVWDDSEGDPPINASPPAS